MVWLWIFALLFHVTNGEDIEVFRVKRVDEKCCLTVNETVMFTQNQRAEKALTFQFCIGVTRLLALFENICTNPIW